MDTEVKEEKQEEPQGEKPEVKATETVAPTVEDLQKKLDELTRHAKNKEEEAARVQKKVEAFEQAEKKRIEAQLTKEQLAEKQKAEAEAKSSQALAAAQKLVSDADAKLLKAAFLLKAKDLGFENPSDAFALADKSAVTQKDGEYEEASIEAALKPLIGRLPIKTQGDGKGTPKLPPAPVSKTKQEKGRAYTRTF